MTALFCSNDFLAIPILRAALRTGIRVPQDWSIVGFDNDDTGALCSPALTTIAQDFYHLGVLAAELLLSRMRPSTPIAAPRSIPVKLRMEPNLIARSSVASL